MRKNDLQKSGERSSVKVSRRGFIVSAAAGGSLLSKIGSLDAGHARAQSNSSPKQTTAVDFSRSFCHCIPRPGSIWVRIQIECRCELFDLSKGLADEYLLGVQVQTGLHKAPAIDPGYDFWVIFSKEYVYNKRVHATSYNNNPDRVPVEQYGPIGWQLHSAPATMIRSAEEFSKALKAWQPITARTVFAAPDGTRGFSIEYPVKWADTNLKGDKFRVETGPVILLNQERAHVGNDLEFEDFQWAYLDYRSFDRVRCLLERSTPILENAAAVRSTTPSRNPGLTPKQVDEISNRLFQGWSPPISSSALLRLFQTNHYSAVAEFPVKTFLYALEPPTPSL